MTKRKHKAPLRCYGCNEIITGKGIKIGSIRTCGKELCVHRAMRVDTHTPKQIRQLG